MFCAPAGPVGRSRLESASAGASRRGFIGVGGSDRTGRARDLRTLGLRRHAPRGAGPSIRPPPGACNRPERTLGRIPPTSIRASARVSPTYPPKLRRGGRHCGQAPVETDAIVRRSDAPLVAAGRLAGITRVSRGTRCGSSDAM